MPFAGLIDEVRVYRRALKASEIQEKAYQAGGLKGDRTDLVLALSFDDSKGSDTSGLRNHGVVTGGAFVAGKSGKAMKFAGGVMRGATPNRGFKVRHAWTTDLPLLARAMLLSGKTLLVAGPADLVDEEKAVRTLGEPVTKTALAEQLAAIEGKKGGHLWGVSTESGEKLFELKLDSTPIFDGMAAAAGKLFIVTTDGKVLCLGGK